MDVHNFLDFFKTPFQFVIRDISLKQSTVNRLEELQKELKLESKQRLDNEVEMRSNVETMSNKLKLYTDESVEAARKITTVS